MMYGADPKSYLSFLYTSRDTNEAQWPIAVRNVFHDRKVVGSSPAIRLACWSRRLFLL